MGVGTSFMSNTMEPGRWRGRPVEDLHAGIKHYLTDGERPQGQSLFRGRSLLSSAGRSKTVNRPCTPYLIIRTCD
jgi:hypothetical protein